MHAMNISHGDLKPANLLLSACGGVKLVDFGGAHYLGGAARAASSSCAMLRGGQRNTSASETAGSSVSTRHSGTPQTTPRLVGAAAQSPAGPSTEVRRTLGTPAFMAPEACGGQPFQGTAADCWALGVCLYLAVLGRLPFRAPSVLELYEVIRCVPPAQRPNLPSAAILHEHGIPEGVSPWAQVHQFHTAFTIAVLSDVLSDLACAVMCVHLCTADQARFRLGTTPAFPANSAACCKHCCRRIRTFVARQPLLHSIRGSRAASCSIPSAGLCGNYSHRQSRGTMLRVRYSNVLSHHLDRVGKSLGPTSTCKTPERAGTCAKGRGRDALHRHSRWSSYRLSWSHQRES